MSFKYVGTTGYGKKYTTRRHKVSMVIIHAGATTSLANLKATIAGSAREVSANAIGYEGGILLAVPEQYRAWTSGSATDGGKGADFDHKALTIEMVNNHPAPKWGIAEKTYQHVARWIAYAADKYGFPINRNTVVGHRELYTRYGASYPTACPAGVDMDKLVRLAKQYQTTDTELETIMSWFKNKADMLTQIANAVVRAPVLTGLGTRDKNGKLKKENLAQSIRRGHTIGRQNREKLNRVEAKQNALIKQLAKSKALGIDVAAIEKSAAAEVRKASAADTE